MSVEFSEVWGSVEAMRSAIADGYLKPGRDERAMLVLAAEIDRLIAAATDALAAERRKVEALREALAFCVLYDGGNCLGDHSKRLETARAALAATEQV